MVTGGDVLAGLQLIFSTSAGASKPAQAVGGTIVFCTLAEVACLANLGDPGNFWDRADEWRKISQSFESSWTDISQAYGLTSGDWSGDAANTFSTWFDKNLTPAKDALKALLDELATQLDNVGNAILALDIAGVTFSVISAVFLCTLMVWWAASLGTLTPALTAAGVTYALGLLGWLAVVGTTIAAFVSATGAVETKANDLTAKLWKDVGAQEDARIGLIQSLKDSNNWEHNSDLDK